MSYDWREITKQHGPLVWNAVYRILPSHSESLDCYQDVMLEAFEQSAINEIKNWPALRSESTRNPGSVIAAYGKPERETEETVHYIDWAGCSRFWKARSLASRFKNQRLTKSKSSSTKMGLTQQP